MVPEIYYWAAAPVKKRRLPATPGLRVWSPTTLLAGPGVAWLLGADEARPIRRCMIADEIA